MEIPVEINDRIEKIANDNLSGASAIARSAAECLDEYSGWIMEYASRTKMQDYIQLLIKIGQQLVRAQPNMAPVVTAVNTIISESHLEVGQIPAEIGNNEEKRLKYICTFTQTTARKYLVESKLAQDAIGLLYSKVIHDQDIIMTISASSAIESLFYKAFDESVEFTVYVSESRPMCEGRLLARRLAEHGIKTILIADHAMFHFLAECNCALVGADKVTPSGLVNKIGTSGLAIAAKELKIPFYAATERTKFIPFEVSKATKKGKFNIEQPEQPLSQLFSAKKDEPKPENLSIKNIYFDFTPMDYITGFLTDDGLLSSKQVIEFIKSIKILPEFVL